MHSVTVEELAYYIRRAKESNKPNPIFFLGAGISKSAGIPLANEIVKDILNKYQDHPRIIESAEDSQTYTTLMECLGPAQRNNLLQEYIGAAKINVAHIYLAQMLSEGYVDYILTVNFDNLILRALSLYNEFPSTYDMAILRDLTTTSFKVKSVVYLHGQHHGLWLLNTQEELQKVKETIPPILHSIKNERPWVFIGYSGEDPIFDHIKKLGRFDNGLYWVTYYDNEPGKQVKEFLNSALTNASIIEGHDADSFMLKLNSELGLPEPLIIDKPFTSLQGLLKNIVDIDEHEHFKGVKERLEIVSNQVDKAIQQFEKGNATPGEALQQDTTLDLIKKEIIDLIIKEKYNEDDISQTVAKTEGIQDKEIANLLADLYLGWGNDLGALAKTKNGEAAEDLFNQAVEKYEKAIEIKSDKHEAYNNWGITLGDLARINSGKMAEVLYQQSIEKYQKAVEIKADKYESYHNWGIDLVELAKIRNDETSEGFYIQAIEKYKKAIEIKADFPEAFNSWGYALGNLAKTKNDEGEKELYHKAFEKYQKAIEIKADFYEAYINWGNTLGDLAKTKEDQVAEELYQQAFEKYKQAIEIKVNNHGAYVNWGQDLAELAKTKSGEAAEVLFNQAFEKYQRAFEIKRDSHEALYRWAHDLAELAKTKNGEVADELYRQSFEKYQQAVEIKPNFHIAFNNWGYDLEGLAKTKNGQVAEDLFDQAFEKYQKASELGGGSYNLSCLYALRSSKQQALHYLEISLSKKDISGDFVRKDEDWKEFLGDEDFIALLEKYDN
ncbi:MAG: SIR2 family protein [Cyclobacteriaceae bacterium]